MSELKVSILIRFCYNFKDFLHKHNENHVNFLIRDGYLSKGVKLYIPHTSLRWCLFFYFILNRTLKISGDSDFSKNHFFHKINKKTSFTIEWERIERNAGSTKSRLYWGVWGSNLNLRWGKCGIWLVDWWIPSLCVFLCLSDHSTLRILMWRFSMLDCYIHLWLWHVDDIDRFCSCHDYSTHLDMYILLVSYLIHLDMIDFLGCILSWLSWSMISLLDIHFDYHILA